MQIIFRPGVCEVFALLLGVLLLYVLVSRKRRSRVEGHKGGPGDEYFRLMVDAAGEGIWLLDDAAHIVYANRRIAEMFSLSVEDMVGKTLFEFVDARGRGQVEAYYKHARLGQGNRFEVCFRRRDGGPLWALVASRLLIGDGGRSPGTLWVLTDISERKERERVSSHLTQRDPLTGLPNRILLFDRIAQDLGRAYRYDTHVAILFLDLDRFKQVNDAMGHGAGDQVLIEVAKRLASRVRRMDTVARFGGDEFVVVLSDLATVTEAESVAGALVALLAEPFLVAGRGCNIGASIGISVFPGDGQSGAELLDKADAAMYRAKQAGGGCYRLSRGGGSP